MDTSTHNPLKQVSGHNRKAPEGQQTSIRILVLSVPFAFRLPSPGVSSSASLARGEANVPIHPSQSRRHPGSLFADEKPVLHVYSFKLCKVSSERPSQCIQVPRSWVKPGRLLLDGSVPIRAHSQLENCRSLTSQRCWRAHTCREGPAPSPWGNLAFRNPFLIAL